LNLGLQTSDLGAEANKGAWDSDRPISHFINFVEDKLPEDSLSNLEEKYTALSLEEKQHLFARVLDMYYELAKADPSILLDTYAEAEPFISKLFLLRAKPGASLQEFKEIARELNNIFPGCLDTKSAHEKIESNPNNIAIVNRFFDQLPGKERTALATFEKKVTKLPQPINTTDPDIEQLNIVIGSYTQAKGRVYPRRAY
jgi:hypothetical protein